MDCRGSKRGRKVRKSPRHLRREKRTCQGSDQKKLGKNEEQWMGRGQNPFVKRKGGGGEKLGLQGREKDVLSGARWYIVKGSCCEMSGDKDRNSFW